MLDPFRPFLDGLFGMATGLNSEQHSAVKTLSGPLLVLAGAGTGKTRVITYRIAELIQSGVTPSRILALTFTNKAAKEMRERALALLGKRPKTVQPPEISTFHSLCVRILRRHITRLGYPKEFVIYDRGDQEALARNALRDIRVGQEKLRPGDLITKISGWKTLSIGPEQAVDVAKEDKDQLAAAAYVRYQAALKSSGALDFDDLLMLTEELLVKFPEVRFAESTRHDHVLIDEYQDTNGLQYRIVRHLAQGHGNLCVVGDDDQSIYGWRGAEVTHILNFSRHWPKAKVVRLQQNYRSKASILELANTLIVNNKTRHDKKLYAEREGGASPRFIRFEDETKEAEEIVKDVREQLTPSSDKPRVHPGDIAILFRTNEQPRVFELELRRAKIPYVIVGGLSFFDRKEVRDIMAYLRVLANPKDELSLLRILNTPPRGIGTGSIETLLEHAVEKGVPLWNVLAGSLSHPDIGHHTAERILQFQNLLVSFQARLGEGSLADLAKDLLTAVDYKAELDRTYKTASEIEARTNSLEELVNSLAQYEQQAENPSLLGFLEEATLTTKEDQKDDDKKQKNALTLMTLHSAKGLEFPHVYLVGVEEGIMPHRRSLLDGTVEEERRLCYVGVTRAQDHLTISFCKQRMKWGKERPCIPSRFILEMRGENEKAEKVAQAALELFTKEKLEEEARKAPKKVSKKVSAKSATPAQPRSKTKA
ncbi:MAG: UvrD-helicase domain-containing protein [Polyangiaceae bacterium]|nr:UvrD-helicase domain-containing protein [Polyangiaceae bacterium]